MTNFHIAIEPVQGNAFAASELNRVNKRIGQIAAEDGEKTMATFCELIIYNDGRYAIRGRVFSGEAVTHLKEHLEVASGMQNAIEGEQK